MLFNLRKKKNRILFFVNNEYYFSNKTQIIDKNYSEVQTVQSFKTAFNQSSGEDCTLSLIRKY